MALRSYDVIVIGAGAAGLMASALAGQRGRRVVVLDHNAQPGRKILISGGGRCNFTNLHTAPDRFLSVNPHFCKSALARYRPQDFLSLLRKHNVGWHEKEQGQLFCNERASAIVDVLMHECAAGHVDFQMSCHIQDVSRAEVFRVQTSGDLFEARTLILATGGMSVPKVGASGFSYVTASHFGLALVPPRPGLVPLTFTGEITDVAQRLAGVSLDVTVECGRRRFTDSMLMTHRGLSGPAILQISSYWQNGQSLTLDLAPRCDLLSVLLQAKRQSPRVAPRNVLAEHLPKRLAVELAARFLPQDRAGHAVGDVPDACLRKLAERIHHFSLTPSGHEGYDKAEVTVGGVSTHELSSKDMQARNVPGLFVIGEAVDVTGWLGGYNFQWAWSSAYAAAIAA